MNKILVVGLILMMCVLPASASDYSYNLNHDGLERNYLVHTPNTYKESVSAPMIIVFHGLTGTAQYAAKDSVYHWITKSNKEGFIAVFPNGMSSSWNAGNCCGYASSNNIDDVGFIRDVISDMESKFNINSNRIYATGMSNGGMFSHRLACDLADELAGIASVAGSDSTKVCYPANPIQILHIHAINDNVVSYNGGGSMFASVPETISRWVNRNNCDISPKHVAGNGVYYDLYTGCDSNVQIKLFVTSEGGHSWPGSSTGLLGATPSTAISATDEIWAFFNNSEVAPTPTIPHPILQNPLMSVHDIIMSLWSWISNLFNIMV